MVKLLAILLGAIILVQLALALEAGAIKAGPYNVTVDIPGFDKVNIIGPLKSEVQQGANGNTQYMLSLENKNENGHKLIITILKYNMPLPDLDNQLEGYYGDTFRDAYLESDYLDKYENIMVDGCLAKHGHVYNTNHDYIVYYKNKNTEVDVDCRNLSPDEYASVLDSLNIQEN